MNKLLALLSLALVANAQVLKVTNGQIAGDISTGTLQAVPTTVITAVNQAALIWASPNNISPGTAFSIYSFANQIGLQYSIAETFTDLNGGILQASYLGSPTQGGTGGTTIFTKTVPVNQSAGRYDYTVTVTGQAGNPVNGIAGVPQVPTTFSVWVGTVPSDFVRPNLDVRIASVALQTSSSPYWALQITGFCRTGGLLNIFQGTPPNEGTITTSTCRDGQNIYLPLLDLGDPTTSIRWVVVTDSDGMASASMPFMLPSSR